MKISDRGIALIKETTKCSLDAYVCPIGLWTIGYRHTKGVKAGDTITQAQADTMLINDLKVYETEVNIQNLNLTQNQFDALISLVYNIGGANFRRSALLRKLKKDPNSEGVIPRWRRYNINGKKVSKEMSNQRENEIKLYTEI